VAFPTNDFEDEPLAAILVRQAQELMEAFGFAVAAETRPERGREFMIEVARLTPPPHYGSKRYREVANSLDRLTVAEAKLAPFWSDPWKNSSVNGRSGKDMVTLLVPMRDKLQELGEGAPTPKLKE
jgi:hypothetical protein